jgi:hypothetical protein
VILDRAGRARRHTHRRRFSVRDDHRHFGAPSSPKQQSSLQTPTHLHTQTIRHAPARASLVLSSHTSSADETHSRPCSAARRTPSPSAPPPRWRPHPAPGRGPTAGGGRGGQITAGLGAQQPRPLPRLSARLPQPREGGLIDRGQHPPRGRRRGHLTEQPGLVAQHRQIGDRMPTVGEHHRHVGAHSPRIVPRTALPQPGQRTGERFGHPRRTGQIHQQPSADIAGDTRPSVVTDNAGRLVVACTNGVPLSLGLLDLRQAHNPRQDRHSSAFRTRVAQQDQTVAATPGLGRNPLGSGRLARQLIAPPAAKSRDRIDCARIRACHREALVAPPSAISDAWSVRNVLDDDAAVRMPCPIAFGYRELLAGASLTHQGTDPPSVA